MPKVLVADDDSRMVRLLSMTLPAEYDVDQAGDGEEAVKKAEEMVPDLILLDVNMPGLNGFEVLRRVKQMPALAHTKVVMVTARTDEADRFLGTSLGADEYLTKPFSPLMLLQRVTELLGEG
ncbi:MAG: response regulator [SAR202 cluster bacterium]|jgi:DNA-binding response OmpR family regulator|nr:response regulator [SAR202 cluster bacterium]MDP6715004.1 response regulator [SAR202 cluster bacterium]